MRHLALILLAALLALTGAVPALASTRGDIIADCSDDGQLQGSYKPSQLRDARKHLPSDVAEYTDCGDVLRRAELPDKASPGGGGGAGGGGGTPTAPGTPAAPGATGAAAPSSGSGGVTTSPLTPSTKADQKALTGARSSGSRPVTVSGQKLLPSASDIRDGYRASGLPASLIVALILLALAGIALSLPPVRRALPFWRKPAA